jgi:hypothetical protein
LEPREIIRQFAAIEEIKKKKTKRFFDSSRGSLDPLLMISQTPRTPRKKTKTQSPKSHPKTAIGADFVKKVSGGFFFSLHLCSSSVLQQAPVTRVFWSFFLVSLLFSKSSKYCIFFFFFYWVFFFVWFFFFGD